MCPMWAGTLSWALNHRHLLPEAAGLRTKPRALDKVWLQGSLLRRDLVLETLVAVSRAGNLGVTNQFPYVLGESSGVKIRETDSWHRVVHLGRINIYQYLSSSIISYSHSHPLTEQKTGEDISRYELKSPAQEIILSSASRGGMIESDKPPRNYRGLGDFALHFPKSLAGLQRKAVSTE